MRPTSITALLVLLFASVSASAAVDGERGLHAESDARFLTSDLGQPLRWEGTGVRFVLDARGAHTLPIEEVEDALVAALDAWGGALSGSFAVTYGGRVEDTALGYRSSGPNLNVVRFARESWDPADKNLALTLSTFVQETGELLDTDIVLNELSRAWSTEGAADAFDLQSVLLHEVGHALGLAHHVTDTPLVMHPTLNPGATDRRALTEADVQAVRALYGAGPREGAPLAQTAPPQTTEGMPEDTWANDTTPRDELQLPIACAASGAPSRTRLLSLLALLGLFVVAWSRRWGWVVMCAALAAPSLTYAMTVDATDADAPLEEAELVTRGVVVASEVSWRGGVIVTRSLLRVTDCLHGPCPDAVWIETLGGSINGVGQVVAGAPTLTVGHEFVALLRSADDALYAEATGDAGDAWVPVGAGLGVYALHADGQHLAPTTAIAAACSAPLGDHTHALDLSTLIERIHALTNRP